MSRFKELSIYKYDICEKLLSNNNLVKLLYYSVSNPLEQPMLEDNSILMYSNIFPYRFIPEVSSEAKTYISMKYGKFFTTDGKGFKEGYLNIYIITHKSLITTDYDGLRYDLILEEIENIFNGSRGEWIGKMEFDEMEEVQYNDSYYGVYVRYKITNFNIK